MSRGGYHAHFVAKSEKPPSYLKPYVEASRLHGGSFSTLLWASRETQGMRFSTFTRLLDFGGLSVLDVGCGRADLLDHLRSVGQVPAEYVGIEMVPALAQAAEATGATVLRRDFIADPACLFTASDVIAISGSINTCDDDGFYGTLKRAFDATAHHLIFNFLSSDYLAGASHLFWRKPEAVVRYCRNVIGVTPTVVEDYLPGDATVLLSKTY